MDRLPEPSEPERIAIDSRPRYQQRTYPNALREAFLREQQIRIEREAAAMGKRIEDLR